MELYKTRPGVVLTSICGEYYLVAAKSIIGLCPYVTQINETSAFLWKKLAEGATAEQLENAVYKEYEVEHPDELHDTINGMLDRMLELNYIIPQTSEVKDEEEQ